MKSPLAKITVFILLFAAAGAVSQSLIATDSAKLAGVTPTAAGLALLDDSDATAQRTTLALGSGNDVTFNSVTVADDTYDSDWNGDLKTPTRNALYDKIQTLQAQDADLDALAALSGTNTLYYRSGANTWSPVTIGNNLSFSGGTLSGTHTFVRDVGFNGFVPDDNKTYYAGTNLSSWSPQDFPDIRRTYIPSDCTITKIYGWFSVAGTPAGSSQTSSLYVRKNNTGTDSSITSSIIMDRLTPPRTFSVTDLSIALAAGDYIELKLTTPTFDPNPLGVFGNITIEFTQ